MPGAKTIPKKGLVVAKKGAATTNPTKKKDKTGNKRKRLGTEYEDSDFSANDDHTGPTSNDPNDVDMDLIRAAFASAKSKHTKKQDTEFLKQQKALIDSAREQAEGMQAAGNVHIQNLFQQFESLCELGDDSDIRAFADSVGERTDMVNDFCHDSASALEQITADYEEAIQAAGEEFHSRAAYREKIRRETMHHVRSILEKGVEEQRLITDATEIVKNFQRLMRM